MADFKVSLKGVARDYSMQEGGDGPAAALKADGNYALRIMKAAAKTDKRGDRYLALVMTVEDEDEKNSLIYNNLFLDGEFKSGANQGHKKAEVALNLLTSIGQEAKVRQLLAADELDVEQIAKDVTGQLAYARLALTADKDDPSILRSEVRFWIRKDKYEDSKNSKIGFRTAPRVQASAPRPASSSSSNGAASSTSVSDALAADV